MSRDDHQLRSATCALLLALCACPHSSNQPAVDTLADSVVDFSGEQGRNGWWYGYWDESADADGAYDPETDFRVLPRFGVDPRNGLVGHSEFSTGELWLLEDGRFYTSLWADGGHAHGDLDLGGYDRAAHWAVRRWVAPVGGRLDIDGRAGKVMPWGEKWGGDVRYRVVVGDDTLWQAQLDGGGQRYSTSVTVEAGTAVDFLIGPGSAIGVVRFTATIRPAESRPK